MGRDMQEAKPAEAAPPVQVNRKLLEAQKRKLGAMHALLIFLIFLQLLTLGGLGGLLWHTFLRTG